MGGSFDPVHKAHIAMAERVSDALQLSQLIMIPCHVQPLKGRLQASAKDRLAMLSLAIQGRPTLCVDARELQREGASYSVDTLAEIRQELGPERPLHFILGWDSWCSLPRWHRWEALLPLVNFVVLPRAGGQEECAELQTLRAQYEVPIGQLNHFSCHRIARLDGELMTLASTDIRQVLANNETHSNGLDDVVAEYIASHQLYQLPQF